jgi:microcystin-dependent protein
MFAGNFAPQGWVLCDGRQLSIAEYEALYSLVGTTYGGDGQTSFNVPDLRGRAPMHKSQAYPQGAIGGTESVTLTQQNLPAHTHVPNAKKANGSSAAPAAHYWAGNSDFLCYTQTAPTVPFDRAAIGLAGNSQPHENMMPFVTVSFVMATNGIYPTPN